MKSKIFLAMMLLAGLMITGCYYDVVLPPDPNAPPQNVSFSGDLQPIFDSECASAGCHAGGAHPPDLTAGQSYNALINGGFVNIIVPTESILYKKVQTNMPPTGKLPSSDIQMILDWIKIGAPNN